MELFIISIRYKIKYRNTLRNKGQLRQLCDKNQIKTIAIKSSVKASESSKLALNWKSGSGENNDFITLLQISISSNDFKSRENRAIFLEKLYCQKKATNRVASDCSRLETTFGSSNFCGKMRKGAEPQGRTYP